MTTTRLTFGFLGLAVLTAGSLSLAAQANYGTQRQPYGRSPLTGTYELESTRGDNAQRAADMATRDLPQPQRDRAYQSLLSRLEPPTTLAIDRNGRTVTISSSSGPRTTFDVDGLSRTEVWPGGRQIVTRAEFVGEQLSVSTSGNRETDFLVTFEPQEGGSGLLVTRRMDGEDLARPVTILSYYRRIAPEPRWDVYGPGGGPDYHSHSGPRPPFTIPEGMRIVAVLDNSMNSRTLRSGERFWMTVRSPQQYQGARIEGVIFRVTPYGPSRNADLRVDFDTIRLRNGQVAEFDAVINSVRTPGGLSLRVEAYGDSNRTDATVQQGAVGAALGAIIGAIAGGGKGAAIGAVVGGASGAILAQDRAQYLDLPAGTQVTIIVTAPHYRVP